MSQTAISVIIGLATFVVSMAGVTFAVGRTYGEVRNDIKQIQRDLAKIEGMFVVKIRDEHIDRGA